MSVAAKAELSHQAWLDAWRGRVCHPDAPGWMTELREIGWGRFEFLGFPNQRLEHWKYTRLSGLESSVIAPAAALTDISLLQQRLQDCGLEDQHCLVMVNGLFEASLSKLPEVDGYIGSMADLLRHNPDRVRAFLGAIKANHHQQEPKRNTLRGEAFAALNSACSIDGAALVLNKNAVLSQPLHIVHCYTAGGSMPRNLFLLEQNAEAKVIEWQISLDDEAVLVNGVSEVGLGNNAQLKHDRIQALNKKSWFIESVCTDIHQSARYFSNEYQLGARLSRSDTLVDLKARGAEVSLNGLYLPFGTQHQDCHTRIRHQAADCNSRQLYKGVADKRGRGVFNGLVVVERDAQRTDSEMQNRNILLSPHAEIDAKPELIIYADDVACAHGSTIGQLDQTALFYLRSRGLPTAQAEAILTWAFAAEVIEATEHNCVREFLLNALAERLPGGDKIRGLQA